MKWLAATLGGSGLFGCGGGGDAVELRQELGVAGNDRAAQVPVADAAEIEIGFDVLFSLHQRRVCNPDGCTTFPDTEVSIPFATAFGVDFDPGSVEIVQSQNGLLLTDATQVAHLRSTSTSDSLLAQQMLSAFGVTVGDSGLPPPTVFELTEKLVLRRQTLHDAAGVLQAARVGVVFERDLRFSEFEGSNFVNTKLQMHLQLFDSFVEVPDIARHWTRAELSNFLLRAADRLVSLDRDAIISYETRRPGDIEELRILTGHIARITKLSGSGLCR